ncbi:hypothetical protein CBL_01772 [Carabus blaptoides fortunei]
MACANIVQKIKNVMKNNLEESHTGSDSDSSDKTSEDFSLWSDHHKLVHRNWKSNKTEESVFDELSVSLRTPVGRLNENPIEVCFKPTTQQGTGKPVSALAIPTLLGPRFKKLHFEDPMACANIVQKIKNVMKNNLEESHTGSDSDSSDKTSEDFSLWSDHHKLVHRNWKSNKTEESVFDELSVSLRTPVGRLNENP